MKLGENYNDKIIWQSDLDGVSIIGKLLVCQKCGNLAVVK